MSKKVTGRLDPSIDLLQRMFVFQLHATGMSQGRIAKTVGREKAWVNRLLKGLPKGGQSIGSKARGTAATK